MTNIHNDALLVVEDVKNRMTERDVSLPCSSVVHSNVADKNDITPMVVEDVFQVNQFNIKVSDFW